jgi:hypothetical protein
MMFEVDHGEPDTRPERWRAVGPTDAPDGMAAIRALATRSGWYRARPEDEPDSAWTYCQVTVDTATGAKEIDCPEELPF